MRVNRRLLLALGLLLCTAPAFPQLPPANAAGVATGHIHMVVKDVAASRATWREFGATEVIEGRFVFIRFPGIFLMLNEREPAGPSAGSTAERLTFSVRDLGVYKLKLAALGAKIVSSSRKAIVADLEGGVRVEFQADKRQKDPIQYRRALLATPDPEKLRAWYVEIFGAEASRNDGLLSATVPGGRVDFVKVAAPLPGSRGRSIDHIGFEVADVDAFAAKLKARGIKLDLEPTLVEPIRTKILFFTDPEGTYIELTQGLRGK